MTENTFQDRLPLTEEHIECLTGTDNYDCQNCPCYKNDPYIDCGVFILGSFEAQCYYVRKEALRLSNEFDERSRLSKGETNETY